VERTAEGGGPTKKIAWLALLAAVLAAIPAAGLAAPDPAATDETKIAIPDSSTGAAAGTGTAAATGTVRAPGVNTWDFVRMFVVLAAVVGCIYLLFWLLRRGMRPKAPENEQIRLLGSRSLAGNRALHLVEVGRSVYLVGSAEGGVNLVAEVKDQETIDAIRVQAAEAGGGTRRTFAETLSRIFSPGKPGPQKGPGPADGADFLRKSRDRLRRLGGGS
jgi:flagellar biogenesis protein FliO